MVPHNWREQARALNRPVVGTLRYHDNEMVAVTPFVGALWLRSIMGRAESASSCIEQIYSAVPDGTQVEIRR